METHITITINNKLPAYEVALAAHHDLLLAEDVLLLLRLHDVLLLQALQRERQRWVFGVLDEFDPSEPADTQRGDDVQVIQLDVLEFCTKIDNYNMVLQVNTLYPQLDPHTLFYWVAVGAYRSG